MLKNPIFNFTHTHYFILNLVAIISLYYFTNSYIELLIMYILYISTCLITSLTYDFFNSIFFHIGLVITKLLREPSQNDYVTWVEILLFLFATLCSTFFFIVFYISFNAPITNWLSFPLPENVTLANIILLYTEILFIGVVIIIVILDTIATILYNFKAIPESHVFYAVMNDRKLRSKSLSFYTTDYTTDSYIDEQIEINNYEPYEYSVQSEELFDSIFTFFSTVLIILILVPALGYLYTEEFYFDFLLYDVSVEVVASQWYWTYEIKVQYLFDINVITGRSLKMDLIILHTFLVNEMDTSRLWETEYCINLPLNINIFVSITSIDVVHSWAIPGYGAKADAIPGRISNVTIDSQAIGYIWGQCSELCGIFHGFMPISVTWDDGRFFWNIYIYKDDSEVLEKEWRWHHSLWFQRIRRKLILVHYWVRPSIGPVPGSNYFANNPIPYLYYRKSLSQFDFQIFLKDFSAEQIDYLVKNFKNVNFDWTGREKGIIRDLDNFYKNPPVLPKQKVVVDEVESYYNGEFIVVSGLVLGMCLFIYLTTPSIPHALIFILPEWLY